MENFKERASEKKIRRNSSFGKYDKTVLPDQVGELPPLKVHEAKTIKMMQKKSCRIPFLNLDDLRHIQRPKILSLNHREREKLVTEKKKTQNNSEETSFFFNECELLLCKKNPNYIEERKEKYKKTNFFPPITHQNHQIGSNMRSSLIKEEVNCENKRKGTRTKIQCKVLLSKFNNFPFYGFQDKYAENKMEDRVKTKESNSSQDIVELFELDISRIIATQENSAANFLSEDSFKQIPIF